MSLDEKSKRTIEANEKRLSTLKRLDDATIGKMLVSYKRSSYDRFSFVLIYPCCVQTKRANNCRKKVKEMPTSREMKQMTR